MRTWLLKLIFFLTALLYAGIANAVPDDFGLDFRATSGHATDTGTNTYMLAADTYPTTRGGYTFGRTTSFPNSADYTATDARLAGEYNGANEDLETIQIDLKSTGTKTICVAFGSLNMSDQNHCKLEILDNSTSKLVISHTNCASGTFYDASDVSRTSASDWVSNQVCVDKTFASTTLKIVLGTGIADGGSSIAHIHVADSGGASSTTTSTTSPSTSTSTTTTSTSTTTSVGASSELEKCGNGIDDHLQSGAAANGTKGSCPAGYMDAIIGNGCDKKCPGIDQDNDGYTNDGSLGTAGSTSVDCDDLDRRVIPGKYVPNSWTSPTGYKLCQTNGSYSSTILNATTPLAESSTHNYYIDCDSGNDANSGTWASPFKTLGKVSGGSSATGLPASPKTLVADDVVYLINGTCNQTITSSGIAVVGDFTQAGSSGHRIIIKNYPGSSATIENSSGRGLWIQPSASYYQLDDLQGTADANGGTSGTWVFVEGDYVKIRFPYAHDTAGNGDNNDSSIYCSHTNGCQIEYAYIANFTKDIGNVQGINAVKWLDNYNSGEGNDHWFRWGTVWNPSYSETTRGSCLRQKHGTRSADVTNKHYIEYSTFSNCTDAVWWNGSSLRFRNNIVGFNGKLGDATNNIRFFEDGADTYAHEDEEIVNNTFYGNANLVDWVPKYAGTEHLKINKNIFIDTRTSYTDGNLNGMISIDGYGSDAQLSTFESSAYLTSTQNCFYNANVAANFPYFRIASGGGGHGPAGNGGANYTLTQWQTSPRLYDTTSFEEDPGLDGNNQPTSTHCDPTWGRQYTLSGGSTSTSTTTSSTSSTTSTSASTTSTTSTTSTSSSATSTSTSTSTSTTTSISGVIPLQAMGED